jgi:hypothetical protein
MRRWILLLLLLQGTQERLLTQDARDVQAGGMSIVEQCEGMERRVNAQWEVLEKLLSDWISKEQPDLPAEWEGLSAGLENLQRESDLKSSATGGDLAKDMTALRQRIAGLNTKLASVSEDARRDAAVEVKQVEGRIGALEKGVQSLATVCGSTRTTLDELKKVFEINIQLGGAAKARETLRQKVGDLLVEIRRKRGDAVGAMAHVPTPVPATRESVLTIPDHGAAVPLPTMPGVAMRELGAPAIASRERPFVNSLGMKFVPVEDHPNGKTVLFSIWETRVQDFQAFRSEIEGKRDHPVDNVSWEDAKAFCQWLSLREGKNYRLPTDHEWSLAVGIGDRESAMASPKDKDSKIEGVYPWGNQWSPPNGAGNYDSSLRCDRFDGASPVGSFVANRFGIYDLGGNVWEWCADWYDSDQKYRVLRGGSWVDYVSARLLSSYRGFGTPSIRFGNYGFRCVLEVGSGG